MVMLPIHPREERGIYKEKENREKARQSVRHSVTMATAHSEVENRTGCCVWWWWVRWCCVCVRGGGGGCINQNIPSDLPNPRLSWMSITHLAGGFDQRSFLAVWWCGNDMHSEDSWSVPPWRAQTLIGSYLEFCSVCSESCHSCSFSETANQTVTNKHHSWTHTKDDKYHEINTWKVLQKYTNEKISLHTSSYVCG